MSNQTNAKEKAAAKAPARMSKKDPLTKSQLELINAWWRASNYLAACQLYLLDNPLLGAPEARAPEAHHRGPLGDLPWSELHLHPPEPGHQQV